MLRNLRSIWLVSLVLFAAAACDRASVSSPTAPDAPGANSAGPGGTGATIAGTVSLTGASSMHTQAAGSGLTVVVAGTNISSPVDASGHFELKDVPRGNVQLRFTGTGVDAVLVITAVIENERIQVAVAVSGTTATLITIERTRSAGTEVEVKGAISSVTGGCPTPTFVVNGTTVTTTASTQFKDGSCSRIAVGRRVEVKGTRQANGTVLASRVEVKEQEAENEVELKGTVTSVTGGCPTPTFVVNGTTVTTTASTQFKDGSCSRIAVGRRVEVKGTRQANGTVLASRVEVKEQEAENEVELKGTVTSVTGGCPTPTFVVNGTTVTTTASTRFKDGSCGRIAVGRRVEVKGTRQANGSVLASKVEIED